MKLADDFSAFLRETVNLPDARLQQLGTHVNAIETFLGTADGLGRAFVRTIPQGSWAHQTIIRPLPGKTFDADVLLEVLEQKTWEARAYVNNLHAALSRSGVYHDMIERKDRCVRVDYAGAEHVDVVPYLVIDGIGYITKRRDNSYEDTDPLGFARWMKEHDDTAAGNLRRVVRLLKFLRDLKERFSVKSVILTTLLGSQVSEIRAAQTPGCYADVPTALRTILGDLARYLDGYPITPPSVRDPSGGNRTFDHRWNQETYPNFRDCIKEYADKVAVAYDEPDLERSVALWQDVFGPEFVHQQARTVLKASETGTIFSGRDPGEEFVEERFPMKLMRSASLDVRCEVQAKAGFRSGDLSDMRHRVTQHRSLMFHATPHNVAEPFQVYWKVKNSGEEARQAGGLRGKLIADGGRRRREETTLYRGEHYVECYVIKDGACVARSRRLPVRIS